MWLKITAFCLAIVMITGAVAAALYFANSNDGETVGASDGVGSTGAKGSSDQDIGSGTYDKIHDVIGSHETLATENSTEPTQPNTEQTVGTTEAGSEPPTQQPTVTPDPEPEPTPTQQPTVTPAPEPEPTPTQQPTVTPAPEPEPTPTQQPTVTPAPEPEPTPTQQPTVTPEPEPEPTPTPAKSAIPSVTVCTQVGPGKLVVAGNCSVDTEYVRITGSGITQVDIYPDKGSQKSYFIGTVYYNKATNVSVQSKQPNREFSDAVTNKVGYNSSMKDYMISDEYMPVFCKNSRMHFYSALLCYTLSDKVSSNLKNTARKNITETVSAAEAVGAEVIYLVVPSSAAVYPETVPDEYPAAKGETVYESFKSVAESCGATVIYPLDTMIAHKNDGDGLKIYHNTDSHWSTYGAYWGLYDLMTYISKTYPAAKPRTLSEMGFYTAELYAGDSVFSFPSGMGFEDLSQLRSNGMTAVTRLKELAPLYSKDFATNTLYNIFRGNKSLYIDQGNGDAATVEGGGDGLPTAMVMRDSFGCTVYDMLNDRFSAVYWQDSGNYEVSSDTLEYKKPDYLIYVISERNLLKVMTDNENAAITSLK